VYPLGRTDIRGLFRGKKRLLVEKAPFFVFTIVSSIITFNAQEASGAITPFQSHLLSNRVFVSIQALGFYLFKMVWPVNLAPVYLYPEKVSIFKIQFMAAAILVAVITIFSIWKWRRHKVWATVWAYYVVCLFPVLGIIQIGDQVAADRYTYLSSLGPFFLIGIGMAKFIQHERNSLKNVQFRVASLVVMFFMVIIILLSNMTIRQGMTWKDSFTLWNNEMRIYPGRSYKAYFNRGRAYLDRGDYVKALEDINKSLTIKPEQPLAYYNRGIIFDRLGDFRNAIEDYTKSSDLDPEFEKAYYNRGKVFEQLGEYPKALRDFHATIELDPQFEKAYYNLGVIYDYNFRNYKEAVWYYSKAIELNPEYAMAYNNRGVVFAILNDFHRAIDDFSAAIAIHEKDAAAYYNRGLAYRMIKMDVQALRDLERAAQLGNKNAREYLRTMESKE
jgi:tetratricopeptide (TPR) repeat protein